MKDFIKNHLNTFLFGNIIFFLLIFIFHILLFYKFLFLPPNGDALISTFNTAVYLKNSHFDYARLLNEINSDYDSVQSYPYNIFSFFIAILYNYFLPKNIFLIIHLIVLLCSALTFFIYYKILNKWYNSMQSILVCLIAVLEPVYSGQCSSLYHEIPVNLFIALCLYFYISERYILTSIICVLSYFLIKPTSLLLMMVFIIYEFMMCWISKNRTKRFYPLMILSLPVIILLIHYLLGCISVLQLPALKDVMSWNKTRLILLHINYLIPTIFSYFLIILFLVALTLMRRDVALKIFNNKKLFKFSILLFGYIVCFWLSYVCFYWPLPRYSIIIVFANFILINILLSFHVKTFIRLFFFIIVGVLSFLNENGKYFPELPAKYCRWDSFLERSGEHNENILAKLRLCDFIQKNYYNYPLVCKYSFIFLFSNQEFGYVDKNFSELYSLDKIPLISTAKKYSNLLSNSNKMIFIDFDYPFSIQCDNRDKILYFDLTFPKYPFLAFQKPAKN